MASQRQIFKSIYLPVHRQLAQRVGKTMEHHLSANSLTLAIQVWRCQIHKAGQRRRLSGAKHSDQTSLLAILMLHTLLLKAVSLMLG